MNKEQEMRDILSLYFKPKEVTRIMDRLKDKLFFVYPASTRYHLAIKGGLALHSINVYNTCMELLPILGKGLNKKDVAIVSLFHDLNKIMERYSENILKSGERGKVPYTKEPLLTGDGATSCYLIRDLLGISLSPATFCAIANHNIYYPDWQTSVSRIKKGSYVYKLMLLLITADLYCSQVLEVTNFA